MLNIDRLEICILWPRPHLSLPKPPFHQYGTSQVAVINCRDYSPHRTHRHHRSSNEHTRKEKKKRKYPDGPGIIGCRRRYTSIHRHFDPHPSSRGLDVAVALEHLGFKKSALCVGAGVYQSQRPTRDRVISGRLLFSLNYSHS